VKIKVVCVALCVFAALFFTETLHGQGTSFTYQGQLNNGGSPANGSYRLIFTLFNTNTGGSVLAGPITNSAVTVSDGLFTTTLNFGGSVFNGDPAWLEIAVSTNGNSNFITLSPLQLLTPTPYAIAAGNVTGVVPSGGVSGTYGSAVTFSNAANQFAGNGAGLTGLNASQISSGTVANARLPTNVTLLNGSQIFSGVNNFTNLGNSFNGSINANANLVTPALFGAADDGVTDDTLALSNAVLAINASGFGGILDLQGKTNLISHTLPEFTSIYSEVRNGAIIQSGANNPILSHATDSGSDSTIDFYCHDLVLTFSASNPGTNCIGIMAGDTTTANYWTGFRAQNVKILNAYRGISIWDCAMATIDSCKIWGVHSNAVYINGYVDPNGISLIGNNDFDQQNGGPYFQTNIAQNTILIQSDVGVQSFEIDQGNFGGAKQALVCKPNAGGIGLIARISNCSFGNGFSINSNLCYIELWNSTVVANGVGIYVADQLGSGWTDSAVYRAGWGIYYTNEGGYFGSDIFMNGSIQGNASMHFDVWQQNTGGDTYRWPICFGPAVVLMHTAWNDSGATETLSGVDFSGTLYANQFSDYSGTQIGNGNVFASNISSATNGFNIPSNAWNVATYTNGMGNFSSSIVSSNGTPVVIYMSNGVPYVYYLSPPGGGIIP
jgi:hypothetical protein